MGPFDVNPDWFEKYWLSPEPPKPLWPVPAAFATLAAVVLAMLFIAPGNPSTISSRLSPPFARIQIIPHFNSAAGE
jgi:hypothetical protein